MLKKGFRLRKKEDFDRVFRSGKPLFFNEVGCRYAVGRARAIKLGFSLSKKYLPKATERNRFRRIFSEAFFQLKENWPENTEMVIFVVRMPAKITLEGAKRLVSDIFSKINQTRKA